MPRHTRFLSRLVLSRLGCVAASGIALAALLAPAPASAQQYPTKPIRMLIGFSPGATADLLARIVAEPMSKILGQPIVIEPRPGANSALSARMAATSPADGYTILFMASAMVSNLHGMKDPGYKMPDFVSVGGFADSPFAMMVSTKSSPVKTLKELIDIAKANPDKLNYASLGASSPANLASQRLAKAAGFKWREIPFKSGSDGNLATISGTVDAYFAAPASALPIIKDQPSVIVVAVTGKERNRQLPNVPTFSEQGYDIQDAFSYGILALAGTPQPIVDRLRAAFEEARGLDETKKRVEATGLNVYQGGADKYFKDLMEQYVSFEQDFKTLGIEKE